MTGTPTTTDLDNPRPTEYYITVMTTQIAPPVIKVSGVHIDVPQAIYPDILRAVAAVYAHLDTYVSAQGTLDWYTILMRDTLAAARVLRSAGLSSQEVVATAKLLIDYHVTSFDSCADRLGATSGRSRLAGAINAATPGVLAYWVTRVQAAGDSTP